MDNNEGIKVGVGDWVENHEGARFRIAEVRDLDVILETSSHTRFPETRKWFDSRYRVRRYFPPDVEP